MKRKWLVAALALVIVGAALFGVGAATGGIGDMREDVERKTAEYLPEEVTSLYVELTSADVNVEATQDDKITVEYFTAERDGIDVEVEDGVLKITQRNNRDWRDYISFTFSDQRKVKVKVPVSLAELSVSTTSGEIEVKSAKVEGDGAIGSTSGDVSVSGSFAALDLGTTSGEIDAKDVAASGGFEAGSTSGRVTLASVQATGDMTVSTTSGSIKMTDISANSFDIGSVSGKIRTKNLNAANGTGRMTFTSTSGQIEANMAQGGEFSFSSVSGDVEGKLPGAMLDYSITSGTVSGDNSLPEHLNGGTKTLSASTTSGDIEIEFETD